MEGATIKNLHVAGLSYKDIKPTQGFRVDENGEIVVVTLRSMRITSRTGKFVASEREIEQDFAAEEHSDAEIVPEVPSEPETVPDEPSDEQKCEPEAKNDEPDAIPEPTEPPKVVPRPVSDENDGKKRSKTVTMDVKPKKSCKTAKKFDFANPWHGPTPLNVIRRRRNALLKASERPPEHVSRPVEPVVAVVTVPTFTLHSQGFQMVLSL